MKVDPDQFAPSLGAYTMRYFGRTSTMLITQEDDALWAEVQGLPRARLCHRSLFCPDEGRGGIDFLTNDNAPPAEIALNWAGHSLMAQRIAQ